MARRQGIFTCGYAPYFTRFDHLKLQFLWDKRPHILGWYVPAGAPQLLGSDGELVQRCLSTADEGKGHRSPGTVKAIVAGA
jgi:hypothetical protein